MAAYRAFTIAAALGDLPDWDRARKQFRQTVRLAAKWEARPDLAVTHFRFAEILHKKGDLDAAREQLDQAAALFADMEMTWWSEQAKKLRGRIKAGEPWRGFAPYLNGEYIG